MWRSEVMFSVLWFWNWKYNYCDNRNIPIHKRSLFVAYAIFWLKFYAFLWKLPIWLLRLKYLGHITSLYYVHLLWIFLLLIVLYCVCAHDLLFLKGSFIFITFYRVISKFMKINQCPTCSLLFYWVSNSGWDMVTFLQLCGLWGVQLHTLHWNALYKLIQTLLLLEKRFVVNLIMSSSVWKCRG